LTHHEIISLIEPFTRRGHRPDLAASNRLDRKLIFKPVDRGSEISNAASLRETLELESRAPNTYRLTRRLTCVTSSNEQLEARLEAEGEDLSGLLTSLNSIAPEKQFSFGPKFAIARSYRLLRDKDSMPGGSPALIITRARVQLDGLTVAFAAPRTKGWPEGDIELLPTVDLVDLPDDLLAVLGRDWEKLTRSTAGWKSSLTLPGKEPRRSRRAELKLDAMAGHLAQTLAEKPARFHERLAGARWGVVLRRATPLLISIAAIAATLALPRFNIGPASSLRPLLLNAPPLLLLLVFTMRKVPRIEIPPFPRRSKALEWKKPAVSAASRLPQKAA
jgi:hypothetical protein